MKKPQRFYLQFEQPTRCGTAISTINNGGDLGKILKEVTSGSNLENIAIAALSAGATSGIVDKYFSNTADTAGTLTATGAEGVVTSQAIPGYVNNSITHGFHLNTSAGMAGFAEHAAVQAFSNAAISTAIKIDEVSLYSGKRLDADSEIFDECYLHNIPE